MRVLKIPEILKNPYVIRREKEPLSPPDSIKTLSKEDRAEIDDIYNFANGHIDLEQNCEEILCNILMGRKDTGRDIVLSGRIVETIIKMKEDKIIKLEELEYTFLKERFFPEDFGKKDDEKVFQGFGLTPGMYPLLDAIENAPKEQEVEDKPTLELRKPVKEEGS